MHVPGDINFFTDYAVLRSPALPASGPDCQISFYYWLLGNSTGSIDLYISTNISTLWRQTDAPTQRWNQGIVNLGANPAGWKVFFELQPNSEDSTAWTDDVAIDDISFNQCSENRTRNILDCDFEIDFCSWETNGLADFNWTRGSAQTTSTQTGPPGDHTTGKGYYVYIEASYPQEAGDRAWLASPLVPSTSASCLVFYYHM